MSKKNDQFKELQSLWYDKLKQDGFDDIEQLNEERSLKEWDFNFFRNKYDEITYQTTLIYYQKARSLLKVYHFKNETHKSIWEMHCDGLTEREIAIRINIYGKSWVHEIIGNIRKTIRRD